MPDEREEICLAMVVRDEAATIARCLYSVLPVVSSWVVFDTGSRDGTRERVREILSRLPGELRQVPFTTFSDLRNRLIESSARFAGRALFIDADEILHSNSEFPGGSDQIGLVETGPQTHSFFPARLVPTHTSARFRDPVAEWLDYRGAATPARPIDGVRILHLSDGCRWKTPAVATRDLIYLESCVANGLASTETELSLAHAALRAGHAERACEVLGTIVDRGVAGDHGWYACYLLALVREQRGAPFEASREYYVRAHEMRPDKLEPLSRLIRLSELEGDLPSALALSRLGIEVPKPDRGYYLEPQLHRFRFRMRHAGLCQSLGHHEEAMEAIEPLLSDPGLSFDVRRRLEELKGSITSTRGVEPAAAPSTTQHRQDDAAPPRLTVGMATFDDFDGVYFSVQALCAYHGLAQGEEIEIVIIDNNPDGPCAEALRRLARPVPGCRYVTHGDTSGTAVRDLVFREARGEMVLCMDSHVLIAPGGIDALLAFFDANPQSRDLLQGPLLGDDQASVSTHMEPVWNDGFFGVWERREFGDEPFEIPMQGLGLFACRREAWPGFNPRFRGFGGEEGYIHEKFRRAGGRCLCLPALKWLHRFQRPLGVHYELNWADRVRNYMIGFDEVGLDVSQVEDHFIDHLSAPQALPIIMKTRCEIDSPFHFFDMIFCINLAAETARWACMRERFERLGIAERVVRFDAVSTPDDHHVGCTLSHRAIVEKARSRGLENVLVFEDDAVFQPETTGHLRNSIDELRARKWRVLQLGGHRWGARIDPVEGCKHLGHAGRMTCSHAVAYHGSVFEELLDAIPGDEAALRAMRPDNFAIDQYLANDVPDRYVTLPVLSSQGSILDQEDPRARPLFA